MPQQGAQFVIGCIVTALGMSPGLESPHDMVLDTAMTLQTHGILTESVNSLTEDAIRLLDGRQSGLEPGEKFGDILDTGGVAAVNNCERGT